MPLTFQESYQQDASQRQDNKTMNGLAWFKNQEATPQECVGEMQNH